MVSSTYYVFNSKISGRWKKGKLATEPGQIITLPSSSWMCDSRKLPYLSLSTSIKCEKIITHASIRCYLHWSNIWKAPRTLSDTHCTGTSCLVNRIKISMKKAINCTYPCKQNLTRKKKEVDIFGVSVVICLCEQRDSVKISLFLPGS